MEVFVALIMYCSQSSCSLPSVQAIVNSRPFETEEQCIVSLLENGIPYVKAQGAFPVKVDCMKVQLTEES